MARYVSHMEDLANPFCQKLYAINLALRLSMIAKNVFPGPFVGYHIKQKGKYRHVSRGGDDYIGSCRTAIGLCRITI